MTNNPTACAPNPDRLSPPGVLASIPTRQEKITRMFTSKYIQIKIMFEVNRYTLRLSKPIAFLVKIVARLKELVVVTSSYDAMTWYL